jgi:hypothetical protein
MSERPHRSDGYAETAGSLSSTPLGDPVVAQAEFDWHLVGGKRAAPTQEPNWDAMNGGKR